MKDQEVKRAPNQPNINHQLEMVGCTDKNPQALSQWSWTSLIGLTIYFHGAGPIKPQGWQPRTYLGPKLFSCPNSGYSLPHTS